MKLLFPQDVLIRPANSGLNVDPISSRLTDREFFAYVMDIPLITSAGGQFMQMNTVDMAWDFWIGNVLVVARNVASAADIVNGNPVGNLTITDLEVNYNLIDLEASMFNRSANQPARSTLPVPYVIRAGQNFRIQLDVPAYSTLPNYNQQIIVEGWKDWSI